jgi:hypothetical protein
MPPAAEQLEMRDQAWSKGRTGKDVGRIGVLPRVYDSMDKPAADDGIR